MNFGRVGQLRTVKGPGGRLWEQEAETRWRRTSWEVRVQGGTSAWWVGLLSLRPEKGSRIMAGLERQKSSASALRSAGDWWDVCG